MGRCAMLKVLGIIENPAVEPRDRAASLDPVVLAGLSISMPEGVSGPLLLCRRCLFEDVAGLETEDAPGPGTVLRGAAAIGITPLPPTAPDDDALLP